MSDHKHPPLWIEIIVAILLLASAVLTLGASWGLVRMRTFVQRMHPPALAYVGASWCVTFASIVYFSAQNEGPQLHVWLIIILLSITVPITTVLLARAALFRGRRLNDATLPPALQPKTPPPTAPEQH
ncbi:Na+/H+ antiporter subunit G [Ottowia beijingensis]|uniref:Na+/H+ antiporter subunit G n=1 Tax=Ottowia beijingensis TaxID=1207057 RepID=A0A853IK53_9BURK|nr:Na+/H+ antiporter subunit G [Ottowia beijingensis]NZA00746.1 Na+/H+ antiporter subunit G [Ottowia beijingensis]